jgi:hypothetical protein
MKFLSKLFKKKKTYNLDYVDKQTGEVTKSAIIYDKNKDRLLKLDNDSCAIVIHSGR